MPNRKVDILCDSNNKTFWKRRNNGKSKTIMAASGWGGMNKGNTEDF